jgi:ABC-2 type transport system ATP-binding protein
LSDREDQRNCQSRRRAWLGGSVRNLRRPPERRSRVIPEETVIRVIGLRKRYGEVIAVDGVDLDVRRGEVLGILGPGGAGKTTTLEMIEGLRKPDAGEIEVAGYDVLRERNEMKGILGVMPRTTAISSSRTLTSVVRHYADLRSVDVPPESVRGLLETVALAVVAAHRIGEITDGQRRRLWLALALVDDPRILLLDDPVAGLGSRERQEFRRVVRRIQEAGKTVIVTTRNVEEAAKLCDRIALIDRGRVLVCDNPRALINALGAEAVVSFRTQEHEDLASLEPKLDLLRGVLGREHEGLKIELHTNDAAATVAGVNALASERGVSFTGLSVRRPDLGDVFVAYAGRRPERIVEPP